MMTTVLNYMLALAVLSSLLATLMYITKAVKAKEDKAERNFYLKKAALFFLGYLVLNTLRLYVESGVK